MYSSQSLYHALANKIKLQYIYFFFFKFTNVFVQIDTCICPNWQMFLSKVTKYTDKCICRNCELFVNYQSLMWKMYFSNFQNLLSQVKIAKYIFVPIANFLPRISNVFVQFAKFICPSCIRHLSQRLYPPLCGISSIWIQPKFCNFRWR